MDNSNKIIKFFPKAHLAAWVMWKNILKFLELKSIKHNKISSGDLKKKRKHNHGWSRWYSPECFSFAWQENYIISVSKRRSCFIESNLRRQISEQYRNLNLSHVFNYILNCNVAHSQFFPFAFSVTSIFSTAFIFFSVYYYKYQPYRVRVRKEMSIPWIPGTSLNIACCSYFSYSLVELLEVAFPPWEESPLEAELFSVTCLCRSWAPRSVRGT